MSLRYSARCLASTHFLSTVAVLYAPSLCASDIALVGVFGKKAVIVINGGTPQTLSMGQATTEGVKLLSLMPEGIAVVEVNGVRERLRLGESVVHLEGRAGQEGRLYSDGQGHFTAQGRINGQSARMVVDTGATLVSVGRADAERLQVDFKKGKPMSLATANGVVQVWRVQLDSVEAGGVRLHNVDAVVLETDLPFVLLGMSFLNRTQWQREGDALVLRKRY